MMIPNEVLGLISRRRYVAEVRTATAMEALGVIEALARGGITIFEVSVAIPGAEELVRHFAGNATLIVGAGGVVDARQAAAVARAGARFVAAPIVAPDIIAACDEFHIAALLGALTPTEILTAQRAGSEIVKIFPISAVGGANYLRSLYRQLAMLSVMVSGGVTLENVREYLALPVRAIGLSSALAPRDAVQRGDWVTISSLARQFIAGLDPLASDETTDPRAASGVRSPLLDTMRGPSYDAPPASYGYGPPPEPPSIYGYDPPPEPPVSYDYGPPPEPPASYDYGPPPEPPPPTAPRPYRSTPSMPLPAVPAPPAVPQERSFHPWDSKPAEDDWMN